MITEVTTKTNSLEIRERPSGVFCHASAGMYAEARELAAYGNIRKAIAEACEARIRNYGNMHGVSFRVVTTIKTISFEGGDVSDMTV